VHISYAESLFNICSCVCIDIIKIVLMKVGEYFVGSWFIAVNVWLHGLYLVLCVL